MTRVIVGVILATLLCSNTARAESLDELYEKAKLEKSLTFYAGGPTAPHERRAAEFQKRFPGITVSISGGFSNVLNAQITEQLKEKKLLADFAIFQTVQDFVAWKKEGVLLNFKPEAFDKIDLAYRDEDGAYIATSISPIIYAYNSNLVRPEDAPKSALDFLKPQFAGKLITVYPADDDATLYLFATLVNKYGWSFMDRYMANKPNFIQGHLGVQRSIEKGENAATFDALLAATRAKSEGHPVEAMFSPVEDTPVFTVSAGIFKDAPHPNAAKLYLSWYLTAEQQSRTGGYSPRYDVGPPLGMQSLSSYNLANRYRDFVTHPNLAASRKRFEDYTGPVINRGGVR